MKLNDKEKTIFIIIGILYLFFLLSDLGISHDILVTSVYGIIIGLPTAFVVGIYLIVKCTIVNSRSDAHKQSSVHEYESLDNLPMHNNNSLNELIPTKNFLYEKHPPLKIFAYCGYIACVLVLCAALLSPFIDKLFLLGILFVPLLLIIWIAACVFVVLPLGYIFFYISEQKNDTQNIQKEEFTGFEAGGIIAYFIGVIVIIAGIIYILPN